MAERNPAWRLRFIARQIQRRLFSRQSTAKPAPSVAYPPWRRSFWNADTIERYGAAYERLRRRPDEVMRGPDLVLGLARGYRAEQLAPFVLSLRESGYRGRIVFLVSGLSEATESFLRGQGVELEPFDAQAYAPFHCQNARFFIYLDHLLAALDRGVLPRRILMSDVRDVLFQGDPFAFDGAELDVFYENESVAIGECKFNGYFVYRAFGDEILRELEAQPICCSGTTIATGRGAIDYLIEMRNVMAAVSDRAASGFVDQAAHNIITHRRLVDGLRVHSNGDHVLTLHHVGHERMRIEASGLIVDESGKACPILHQYDRHPMLREAAIARYAPKVETAPKWTPAAQAV